MNTKCLYTENQGQDPEKPAGRGPRSARVPSACCVRAGPQLCAPGAPSQGHQRGGAQAAGTGRARGHPRRPSAGPKRPLPLQQQVLNSPANSLRRAERAGSQVKRGRDIGYPASAEPPRPRFWCGSLGRGAGRGSGGREAWGSRGAGGGAEGGGGTRHLGIGRAPGLRPASRPIARPPLPAAWSPQGRPAPGRVFPPLAATSAAFPRRVQVSTAGPSPAPALGSRVAHPPAAVAPSARARGGAGRAPGPSPRESRPS